MDLPSSVDRVPQHTSPTINERIRSRTEESIARLRSAPQDAIDRRIHELKREWDIERAIEANAASLSLIGLALAITTNRRWLVLPAVVGGFLLQHAIQGWCPPVPVLRRLGFRTAHEIDDERYELMQLQQRGIRSE